MFNNLTPTEFEEFCKDLFALQGFENIDWRKGTGLDSSPSDNGRDIECEYHRYDHILGRTVIEKWFIECKHHKKGVPPDKIQGALSWAQAENPNRLIIMVSEFLTNACKEHIKTYKKNNSPRFEIEIWEKPRLEKLANKFPNLLKKYNIQKTDELLNYFNFYHLRFIEKQPAPSFEILEAAINQLPVDDRRKIFELLFLQYSKPEDILGKMKDKTYEECVLTALKQQVLNTNFLSINTFLHSACNILLGAASPSVIEQNKDFQYTFQRIVIERLNGEENEKLENLFDSDSYRLNKEIMLNLYNKFCDTVIKYIFEHPYKPNI